MADEHLLSLADRHLRSQLGRTSVGETGRVTPGRSLHERSAKDDAARRWNGDFYKLTRKQRTAAAKKARKYGAPQGTTSYDLVKRPPGNVRMF